MVIFSFAIQINFEKYINNQNENYKVLNSKKRVSYLPVVFYFAKNIFFGRNVLDRQISFCIYMKCYGKQIKATGAKDEYLVNCYFTNKEKDIIKKECSVKIKD